MTYNSKNIPTQSKVLFDNLMVFFNKSDNLLKMSNIINGNSRLSLRIIDWFVTNYSKKNDIVYKNNITSPNNVRNNRSFRVYNEYKLNLKAYGKSKFDPFCRWTRITIPYDKDHFMETTIGQLNFFKWAIENDILIYIEENFDKIDMDMISRNSTSRKKKQTENNYEKVNGNGKMTSTRKKREELSISACKCMKTETVNIILHF